MLIKMKDLERIKNGEISVLFRKWKTPRVKKGSTIHSPVGQLKIMDIQETNSNKITPDIISDAGLDSEKIKKELEIADDKTLYLVRIIYHGEDPRISLRNNTNLSNDELNIIIRKLENLDKRSLQGPWTKEILETIQSKPKQRAASLSEHLEVDKTWFKTNVRKLKNLGLTISHHIGYSLSPKGKVILEKIKDERE